MKSCILGIILGLLSFSVMGQYVPSYNQYMYDASAINPAYAGSREVLSASVFYRNQMVGTDGTPNTQTLSAHGPLKNKNIAVGLMLINNNIGVSNEIGIFTNYAYRFNVANGKGKLALGLGAGIFIINNKWSEIVTSEENDQTFATDAPTSVLPDFNAGAYFYTRNYFVGVSIPYFLNYDHEITNAKIKLSNDFSDYNYFLTGGYMFNLGDRFKLKPSVLIILNQSRKIPVDVNINVSYKEKLWIGASYKFRNAAIGLIGIQINRQFSAGYCFEYSTTDLSKYYNNTHEIIIRYELGYQIEAKSPRIF